MDRENRQLEHGYSLGTTAPNLNSIPTVNVHRADSEQETRGNKLPETLIRS